MILVGAILAFVALGLSTRLADTARESAIERTLQTVNQGNSSLDIYFSAMRELINFFESMVEGAPDVTGTEFRERLVLLKRSQKDIVNLAVFSEDGELLNLTGARLAVSSADIRRAGWFTRALSARPSTISFSSPYLQSIFAGQYAWVLTVSTQVSYKTGNGTRRGVLLMDINFNAISSMCESVRLGESGYVYLVDSSCEIVYHPRQQLIASGLRAENLADVKRHVFGDFYDELEGRERYVIVQTINNTRWRLVGVSYIDEMMTVSPEIMRLMVTLSVSGLLLAAAFSVLLAAAVTRPIIRLERAMREVEAGNMAVSAQQTGLSEIDSLSHAFNHMIRRITELMGQIVDEQEAKRLYELNALQAQINPHFLYNTLDSIVWMMEVGDSPGAIEMVTALARLFRISISGGKNLITVAEEIEHANNYLLIQSMRFKDRFDYVIEADPEALALTTVKLIIQPMIENAIVHGLKQFAVDKGLISVRAGVEGEALVLRVSDNGSGMSPEQLSAILNDPSARSGIGVRNVHERIQLTFGLPYGLVLESELDVGTRVTITLPIIRGAGDGS